MKMRCNYKNCTAYENYGARGITYIPAWNDFCAFLADMGECPPGFTLDRIDNAKGYFPGNVRWASRVTQNRNRSCVVWIEFRGETKTIPEWSESTGVPYDTLRWRIKTAKWPVADALMTPVGVRR